MPLLLRWISALSRWEIESDNPEVSIDNIPADAVTDLRTVGNCLSVFQVEDDRSNLTSILTAIAGGREQLKPIHYFLFDPEIVGRLKIKILDRIGKFKYIEANKSHRDLEINSALTLVELAKEIIVLDINTQDIAAVAKNLKKAVKEKKLSLDEEVILAIDKQLLKENEGLGDSS
jgi:hypothetical protein